VVAASGTILGFTLANDVSAWDIERDNPLYLRSRRCTRAASRWVRSIVTAGRDRRSAGAHASTARRPRRREVFAGSASTAS
jgi:2-dehydro-3-deoxy-D-arabinonate dehydratase